MQQRHGVLVLQGVCTCAVLCDAATRSAAGSGNHVRSAAGSGTNVLDPTVPALQDRHVFCRVLEDRGNVTVDEEG